MTNGANVTTDAITGAFGYSGAAIARRLLAAGREVRTLTGHPDRAPADSPITVRPLDFTDPAGLTESLRGVDTLYNTYWVRFAHGKVDHAAAIANSRVLFEAGAAAEVRRVVHVSITHPSLDSPYLYFRGKAEVERALTETVESYAIARPAILFGGNGVLLNNIAWLLRRLPVFAIGGGGGYRIRAIHIDDLADLCISLSAKVENVVTDAVGPESLTFRQLVDAIRKAVGSRSLVLSVPGALIPPLSGLLGLVLRDTLLTADEYRAMADGLADSDAPATGETAVTEWIARRGADLGRKYANELTRHFT